MLRNYLTSTNYWLKFISYFITQEQGYLNSATLKLGSNRIMIVT